MKLQIKKNAMTKIILILMFPVAVLAQGADSVKTEYKKIVKVDLNDAAILMQALHNWRELEMYNPKTTDTDKVNTYKAIDGYITKLQKSMKIDSVKVDPPPIAKKNASTKNR